MNTPSKTNDDNWPDSNLAFYEAVNSRLEEHHDHKPDKPGKFIRSNTSNIEDPISSFSHENNSTIDKNSFEFVLSRINQSLGLNTTESELKHSKKPETSVPIDMPKETHHEKDGIGTHDTKNMIEGEYHENRHGQIIGVEVSRKTKYEPYHLFA